MSFRSGLHKKTYVSNCEVVSPSQIPSFLCHMSVQIMMAAETQSNGPMSLKHHDALDVQNVEGLICTYGSFHFVYSVANW